MANILQRMIFRELVRVFLLSLFVFTAILLMAGIVAEVSQQGLKPAQILTIIPLLIPSTFPYTIPATTLFATCVVYGRLAGDNELLAIRSSGISTVRVLGPGILLGLMTAGASLGLYHHLIPATHLMLRSMVFDDVEEMLYTVLEQQHQINLPNSDYSIYVQGVKGRRLENPIFKRMDNQKAIDMVAIGREAELNVDAGHKLIHVTMRSCRIWDREGTQGQLDSRGFDLPLSSDLEGVRRRPRDMTWQELGEFRQEWLQEEARLKTEVEQERSHSPPGPKSRSPHAGHQRNKAGQLRKQILGIDAEWHMRPALSLGCLGFSLIGCSVGIWLSRSDYLSAFLVCFLPIVFIYYPLLLCGTGLAKGGHLAPGLSVWSADVVLFGVSVWLLRCLNRR